jgi:hypothetical protein
MGKLVMLYFSHVPVDPNSIDPNQWQALQAFKAECKTGGLYSEYASHEQLRTDFGHHLAIELNRAKYIWMKRPDVIVEPGDPELSDDEKRLLLAAASDRYGKVLSVASLDGFRVQSNGQNFVEDSPRSVSAWKRTLKRLADFGYLEQTSEEIFDLTEEGFSRADKELALTPLELSLSFTGTPDRQMLSVQASKPITLKQLDFLMTSEAHITSMELTGQPGTKATIPLDPDKIGELFAAPRPDKNHSDHAGPAVLRLVLMASGRRVEVLLPVLLQPKFVNNTVWIQLVGSKIFTVN